jgi:hypothetical protein
MFFDFICGRCARKEKYSLEERIEMAMNLEQGENECDCGRIVIFENNRVVVVSNKTMKSVLEE